MKTITVKVHDYQDAALARAAQNERVSKSELIRRSVTQYLANHSAPPAAARKRPSLHDRLKRYIPKAGTGLHDLASNPVHLEGLGGD